MTRTFKLIVLFLATTAIRHSSLAGDLAIDYLRRVMDQYHSRFDVYTDANAAGNHFVVQSRTSTYDDARRYGFKIGENRISQHIPAMDTACAEQPRFGMTCIKAAFRSEENPNSHFNSGAWVFINGVQSGDGRNPPQPNLGSYPDAGVDLRGATELNFWAKGEEGGERVEFSAFGVGWKWRPWEPKTRERGIDPRSGKPILYGDSSTKITTGYLTLSKNWRKYSLSVRPCELSYVIGGFGWAASATQNGLRDITFYLDDISFNIARLDQPRFLVSYEPVNRQGRFELIQGDAAKFVESQRNAAHTYDNALALMAFLAKGDTKRAKLIADAFLYALWHDRYYAKGMRLHGAVRNVYAGGDLSLPPGWNPNRKQNAVRLPGQYAPEKQQWLEDPYSAGFSAGNIAWSMLALLAYHQTVIKTNASEYLMAAEEMGEWVERNCRDTRGEGGYTFGFNGWEPNPKKLYHKATEHHIDLYAAFERLGVITGNPVWHQRANRAKRFVIAMWDENEGKFWTGTGVDGVTKSKSNVPVDIQAWAIMALKSDRGKYLRGLQYAESHHEIRGGYDFNQVDGDRDGIWYEGTAQIADAFKQTGKIEKWKELIQLLRSAQFTSGAIPATDVESIATGFKLPDSENDWLYFRYPHVGATAWFILAESGVNPFWFEHAY